MGEGILIYGMPFSKTNKASIRIDKMLDEMSKRGYITSSPIQIGRIGADIERFANANAINLGSKQIYISAKSISHIFRKTKGSLRIHKSDLKQFPVSKNRMNKYYDGEAFIFTDYKVKFIIKPGYKLKLKNGRKEVANLVTAGRVTDRNEFFKKEYIKIK